jgi:hypothetical protein
MRGEGEMRSLQPLTSSADAASETRLATRRAIENMSLCHLMCRALRAVVLSVISRQCSLEQSFFGAVVWHTIIMERLSNRPYICSYRLRSRDLNRFASIGQIDMYAHIHMVGSVEAYFEPDGT